MTCADPDGQGTRVGSTLAAEGRGTRVEFAHWGWPEPNRHFRVSAYCWAAYLRVLKRYSEQGDILPDHQRKHSHP